MDITDSNNQGFIYIGSNIFLNVDIFKFFLNISSFIWKYWEKFLKILSLTRYYV